MKSFFLLKLGQGARKNIQICLRILPSIFVHQNEGGELLRRYFDVCQKEILVGCKRILSHFKDPVFVKLDKDSFHFESDLIIGAVHLSPERSPISKINCNFADAKPSASAIENLNSTVYKWLEARSDKFHEKLSAKHTEETQVQISGSLLSRVSLQVINNIAPKLEGLFRCWCDTV